MTTNSSILAWRIPWAKEPGGLQSMRFQRVRHDLANNNSTIYILAFIMEPHALGGLYASDHDDEYLSLLCESLSV